MSIQVQIRRGTETERQTMDGVGSNPAKPLAGELIYTTDDKLLYVGDGTTTGGNPVGGGAASITDGSLTPAKMSFLGTVDEVSNTTSFILSKQSDGDYDSVTPSGDVTMTQAGAFTIAANTVDSSKLKSDANTDTNRAVTTNHIRDDAVTSAKLKDSASIDTDRAVTTNHIRDNAVTTAKLATSLDFGTIV
jgi:hypothetical protein